MSLSSMDAGAVDLGLACAWYGPEGTMISNEDVKKLCEATRGLGPWAKGGVAMGNTAPTEAENTQQVFLFSHV